MLTGTSDWAYFLGNGQFLSLKLTLCEDKRKILICHLCSGQACSHIRGGLAQGHTGVRGQVLFSESLGAES